MHLVVGSPQLHTKVGGRLCMYAHTWPRIDSSPEGGGFSQARFRFCAARGSSLQPQQTCELGTECVRASLLGSRPEPFTASFSDLIMTNLFPYVFVYTPSATAELTPVYFQACGSLSPSRRQRDFNSSGFPDFLVVGVCGWAVEGLARAELHKHASVRLCLRWLDNPGHAGRSRAC